MGMLQVRDGFDSSTHEASLYPFPPSFSLFPLVTILLPMILDTHVAIMPKESLDDLVRKHHLAPESGLIPRWVTKYSLIHPERNVVLDKG